MVPNDIKDEYPCSEKEVLEIRDILCGRKDIQYTFAIKIFKGIYQNEVYKWRLEEFRKLRKFIDGISLNASSSPAIDTLIEYMNKDINEIQSLIDLFEAHLKSIISENIDFDDKILDFRQSVGIYVGGCNVNEKIFVPNLKKLLECVMGEVYFRISIIYKKGTPCLSIILM